MLFIFSNKRKKTHTHTFKHSAGWLPKALLYNRIGGKKEGVSYQVKLRIVCVCEKRGKIEEETKNHKGRTHEKKNTYLMFTNRKEM